LFNNKYKERKKEKSERARERTKRE